MNNGLLVNALRLIRFLSDTSGGRTHDKPLAAATPYPLPAGSLLWQELGFLAFTLPQVEILMPAKQPRGAELTLEQQRAHEALSQRRLRIEHVHSRVTRCRSVKDRIRLWKAGIRDLVRARCCALPTVRARLTPWQPMI
ncbi:MAG: transposase family protein [Candidatus Tectimicrobiota bacterium]